VKNSNYTILIVDNHDENIKTIEEILIPEGYSFLKARDGAVGVEMAEKYSPDVILLNVLMEDFERYTLIKQLKQIEITKSIPIILTALIGGDDGEKGLYLGAASYIPKPFSPAIVKLIIQNQIKMLEQFREIERLSMHDQLTDLPNRRNFEIRLKAEWGRAVREKTPISILIIDADRFKDYNDTFGHRQGDIALQEVAKVFNKTLKRSADFAARWGGEEFIILLPNTDAQGAEKIAQRVRENVENMVIPNLIPDKGDSSRITISIGLNTRESDCAANNTTDKFISNADTALYEAKNKGRNQICVFNVQEVL
jgi:diguanylate cyclase (GGDEF)-like protein